MFRNFKMVSKVVFGRGCFNQLGDILKEKRQGSESVMVFLVDDVFEKGELKNRLPMNADDMLVWVNVDDEPKTVYVDQLTTQVKKHMVGKKDRHPAGVIGIGGGGSRESTDSRTCISACPACWVRAVSRRSWRSSSTS